VLIPTLAVKARLTPGALGHGVPLGDVIEAVRAAPWRHTRDGAQLDFEGSGRR
jgi:hypothetical protein